MIFVSIDGMGDEFIKGKKTPLEKAYTPFLDELAKLGRCGLVNTVSKEIAPESDIALTAILGYDPYKYYTGRGPIEAFGCGIKITKGDLALRANFSTLNEKQEIIDRRAGRNLTTKEAEEISKAINSKVKLKYRFIFKSEGEHRAILVIKGDFSSNISNIDPAYERRGTFGVVNSKSKNKVLECKPLDNSLKAKKTAEVVNNFINQVGDILKNHKINILRKKKNLFPANIVLLRDAGIKLPNFPKDKKEWTAVVGYPLEIGLAKLMGMKISKISYPNITGRDIYPYLYKCLNFEIEKACNVLDFYKKNKYFWIHFKPTDITGHDGRFNDKVKMLEILDKKFFKKVVSEKNKDKNLKVIVTADHATPCKKGNHSADPVPLLIYDGKKSDKVVKFSEKDCKKGSIGQIIGKDIIKIANK